MSMNSRSRKYFKSKAYQKWMGPIKAKVFENLFYFNAAATHTYLDEKGNVRVRVLSYEEMEDILEKERNGELPAGTTITHNE